MSSYLSNILTNTTSRYNTLRQTLTASETDGDTEDDSHISRVLRAYYTEKGRQLPQWLPPDPRRTASSQTVTTSFASSLRTASSQSVTQTGTQAGRGSLNDLWEQPAQSAAPQQPMSLRRQAAERGSSSFQGRSQETLQPPQARPLPSQRVGSYQTQASQQQDGQQYDPGPPSSSGGGTAQDRLKARLWGAARTASSSNTSQGSGSGASLSPAAGQQRFGGVSDDAGAYGGGRYGR